MGVQASSTSNRSADRVTPLCTVGPRPNRRLASKHPSSSVDLSLDPDELEAAASQYMNLQNMCHAISRVEDNPPASRALVQSGDSKCTSRNNPGNERIDLPTSLMPIVWQRGQLLGAGSYGRVYFGLNMSTGELMAVKQIRYTPGHPTDATRQAALALPSNRRNSSSGPCPPTRGTLLAGTTTPEHRALPRRGARRCRWHHLYLLGVLCGRVDRIAARKVWTL